MAASAAAGRCAVALPGKRECVALLGALLLAVVALAEPAAAAEYKVGDSTGWTIMGSPNYTAWALSKTFRVGDTIVFEYNSQIHNVLEVRKSSYEACNAANPISTHTTGKDSITLKTAGHHYFLCGFPGHCDAGQRVDVNVLSSSSSASPAPAPASSSGGAPAAPSVPSAPAPSAPSPASAAPPPPRSAASPPAGSSGHHRYVAGFAAAVLALAVSWRP